MMYYIIIEPTHTTSTIARIVINGTPRIVFVDCLTSLPDGFTKEECESYLTDKKSNYTMIDENDFKRLMIEESL